MSLRFMFFFNRTNSSWSNLLNIDNRGGDSSVCAALLKAALPSERIFAIHVDLGFMRKDESKKVEKALNEIGVKLKVVDGK